MQGNPKFKAIEESFEGHEEGAVDGISQVTPIDEPDEPTKEHHIQLAGADLPGLEEPASADTDNGNAIAFPKVKKEKGKGGGMKNLFAKFKGLGGGLNKKMILGGVVFGGAFVAVAGYLVYELQSVQNRLASVERSAVKMERMKSDLQRLASEGGGGSAAPQAAQLNEVVKQVGQSLTNLDRRLAQLENAPPPAAAAAAPKASAKKVTAKKADRQPASVKKGKAPKKRK